MTCDDPHRTSGAYVASIGALLRNFAIPVLVVAGLFGAWWVGRQAVAAEDLCARTPACAAERLHRMAEANAMEAAALRKLADDIEGNR